MENVPAPNVALPDTGFSIASLPSGDFFQFLLLITLVIYVVFTGVLFYHWNAYSSDKKVSTATYVTYLVMTIPMILTLISTSVILK